MVKFLAFYMFHRIDSLSIRRLFRLRAMNPDIMVVPCFGVRSVGQFAANYFASRSSHLFELLRFMNQKVETLRRGTELANLRGMLTQNEMSLYCDFTPWQWGNLDLSVIAWFAAQGRRLDFEHLVFLEYDVYTTKTISEIYGRYTSLDAAFVGLREASPDWHWYDNPPGARKTIVRWLGKRGLRPVLYRCLCMAASMLSKRTLEVLADLPLPSLCFCEMRLPTLLRALGFECEKLDFPMVRYRPVFSTNEIQRQPELGIFHPVKAQ